MRPKAKVPLIIGLFAAAVAVGCFLIGQNDQPYFLWAALGAAVLAIVFLLMALTRFLRNRSIVSGLFITTTAVTVLYFVAVRFVNTAIPMATTNLTVANTDVGNANEVGWFTPVFFAQIGLFALWFLLILFIIYVYVRPIKKIDYLLSQIIDAKEIKKLRVGKGRQYQNIAAKLQILADEKHSAALKRAARLAKSRERAQAQKGLLQQIVKEQNKLPPC